MALAHDEPYPSPIEADAKSTSQQPKRILRPHVAYIILLCSLVTIPMIAFTVALLSVIFVNLVDSTSCLNPDLCPGPTLINATSKNFYYIGFPAARLALISSLSGSISLALVGALMAMYAFVEARRIVRYSGASQAQTSEQRSSLNPYQFSILIRVLNADLLALTELGVRRIKSLFGRSGGRKGKATDESNNVLRSSIAVFMFCVLGSALIQAADAYFHIVAESVNLVQIHSQQTSDHRYSRGLAPWCLNGDSVGSSNNRHFWSCALQFNETANMLVLSNTTEVSAVMIEKSTQSKTLNYTDAENVQYSIIGPHGIDLETDWVGDTYGVSTQCSALPVDACTVGKYNGSGPPVVPFDCPESVTGFEMVGNITPQRAFGHYLDSHRYLSEADYFDATTIPELNETNANATYQLAKTLTDEDDNETFRNPWRWVNLAPLYDDLRNKNASICQDTRNWNPFLVGCGALMVFCNTTVWDITYGAINQEVVWINKTKSNGTVAGIASMANMPAYALVLSEAERLANIEADSIESYVKLYESESSHYITSPLATQTSPRAARLVQRRKSQVVTKLPVSALWVLVTANLLFMVIGITLAVLALMSGSADVHQVSSQLGISGLVTQLFGRQDSGRGVRLSSDLLKDMAVGDGVLKRRVTVKVADKGNVRFELSR